MKVVLKNELYKGFVKRIDESVQSVEQGETTIEECKNYMRIKFKKLELMEV